MNFNQKWIITTGIAFAIIPVVFFCYFGYILDIVMFPWWSYIIRELLYALMFALFGAGFVYSWESEEKTKNMEMKKDG